MECPLCPFFQIHVEARKWLGIRWLQRTWWHRLLWIWCRNQKDYSNFRRCLEKYVPKERKLRLRLLIRLVQEGELCCFLCSLLRFLTSLPAIPLSNEKGVCHFICLLVSLALVKPSVRINTKWFTPTTWTFASLFPYRFINLPDLRNWE